MKTECTFGVDFISRKILAIPSKKAAICQGHGQWRSRKDFIETAVAPQNWDSRRERISAKGVEAQSVNSLIEKVPFLVTQKYHVLIDTDEKVTVEKVKAYYLDNLPTKTKNESYIAGTFYLSQQDKWCKS